MAQEQNQKKNDPMLRNDSGSRKKVCLYCVTGDGAVMDTATVFSEQEKITELINNTPGWQYERIYTDVAGRHDAFEEMMTDCSAGKIDVIVTKTIWRFTEDIRESFAVIDRLSGLDPPVEIIFTDEAIFTFDSDKLEDLRKRYFGIDIIDESYYTVEVSDFAKIRNTEKVTDDEEKVE